MWRDGSTSNPLAVEITIGGTATAEVDYEEFNGPVTIPADSEYADVHVTPIENNTATAGLTVTIVAVDGLDYDVATPGGIATVTIRESADATFTLQGAAGLIRYEVPLDEVDPDDDSQSVPPDDFAFHFADGMGGGWTLTEANADFTTSPTAEFEYGLPVGFTFAIDTSAVSGFPYSSISATDGLLTGVDAITTDEVYAEIEAAGPATLVLDFTPVAISENNISIVVIAIYEDNSSVSTGSISLPGTPDPKATTTGYRDIVRDALNAKGVVADKDPDSGARLIIQAPGGKQLKEVVIYRSEDPLPAGPKVHQRIQGETQQPPGYRYQNPPG